MKRSLLIVLCLMTICALLLTACGSPEEVAPAETETGEETAAPAETIEAILGHHCAEATMWQWGAERFAQYVDEYTNGGVHITIYGNSELGDEKQLTEQLSEGVIQFAMPGSMVSTQWVSGSDVFGLPFLFQDVEEARMVLDSDEAKEILSVFNEIDVEILCGFENGFRQCGTTTKKVESIDDLKGLKIRVPESDLYINTWDALGASPTPMSWSEVYSSLQTNVIDGEEVPVGTFYDSSLGEVCKYFAYINYLYDPIFLGVNKTWLESLTPEYQEAIRKAAIDALADERVEAASRNDSTEQKLIDEFGVEFTHPDLAPFQAAVQGIYDNYERQDNLETILGLLGR